MNWIQHDHCSIILNVQRANAIFLEEGDSSEDYSVIFEFGDKTYNERFETREEAEKRFKILKKIVNTI